MLKMVRPGLVWRKNTGLPIGASEEFQIKSPKEIDILLGYNKDNFDEVAWWKSTNGEKSFTKTKVLIREK